MLQQSLSPEKGFFYAGESITIVFSNIPDLPGKAVLRTNLGGVTQRRLELIEENEKNIPPPELDWHDIPFPGSGPERSITLPLIEVGIFEGKCCFIPDDHSPILWAEGENFTFKVTAAASVAGNTIYAAFVRQFGRNLYRKNSEPETPGIADLEQQGFTVIPRSGTFRQLQKHLDHIFDELKCNILQLLPIHPIPAEYGRMGRFGSPFAALDYFSIDPALAEFDESSTPMEQFDDLVNAVHSKSGRIFLDIPVNHTGWASKLQLEHPEYFIRSPEGKFESPGAWGVVWADLCKLDYSRHEVARLMAKVFLFWCRRGVDGFRCDAGYMVPESAWRYIIARVRQEFPETVFLLEGLGGPLELQERLFRYAGLDCGYSEMFQNYTRHDIENCLRFMQHSVRKGGNLISFSETHDNDRLAARGQRFARLRFMVCNLLSTGGAFGFANGAEFFAAEKIDVHNDCALNYGSQENICALIGRMNTLLATHPSFAGNSKITLVTSSHNEAIAALRSSNSGKNRVLILLNPDCEHSSVVTFSDDLPDCGKDLLNGDKITFSRSNGSLSYELEPGGGAAVELDHCTCKDLITAQRAALMEKKAMVALYNWQDEKLPDIRFTDSPEEFVARLSGMNPPPLSIWECSTDSRRILPVPYGDLLLVKNQFPFRCIVYGAVSTKGFITAVPLRSGGFGALLVLAGTLESSRRNLTLQVNSFEPSGTRIFKGTLCQLPKSDAFKVRTEFSVDETRARDLMAFGSNNVGSYALFPADWSSFRSKYEAFIAINNSSMMPVDRYAMFTGLQAYVVINGYSWKIDSTSIVKFAVTGENRCHWKFQLPAGQGRRMDFEAEFIFASEGNAMQIKFCRPEDHSFSTPSQISIILRPEVEDRINHHVTRAADGPEHHFPASVKNYEKGFSFSPAERDLRIEADNGKWVREPEWHYMCDLPSERRYGLEDKTDRFSPGYFKLELAAGESAVLSAMTTRLEDCLFPPPGEITWPLISAMRRFMVKRNDLTTVIAGYPWFLDWGRDTLIALRGLVTVKEFQKECAKILRAFAELEQNGTLPNVLLGGNDTNRDTSDAPLYLIIGTRDYIDATGDSAILDSDCSGRTLREILNSIIENYISGTPNGIHADPESGLIFSPAHFSWMDTNFPTGTPRQGYPVEIQALWYGALKFMGFHDRAAQVKSSVEKYFFAADIEGASDCLHGTSATPASEAEADDHIRSNALLLITMGVIDDPILQRKILNSSAKLLIPGALRSLADQEVRYQLPIVHNGVLLNDPVRPYQGHYAGPEDTSRKVAYHNGTAWCWPFPAYCEALLICGGEAQRARAISLLYSGAEYFEQAVAGQFSEVADGDAPHRAGGCPAQAWSVTELYRVRKLLTE